MSYGTPTVILYYCFLAFQLAAVTGYVVYNRYKSKQTLRELRSQSFVSIQPTSEEDKNEYLIEPTTPEARRKEESFLSSFTEEKEPKQSRHSASNRSNRVSLTERVKKSKNRSGHYDDTYSNMANMEASLLRTHDGEKELDKVYKVNKSPLSPKT